mmetsp:Transcript_5659/g.7033  ORF Transcript_5659/g.7033 Transcript_5659/m.7033 type:complete len:458 (-) Transcript_5659:154-1527(-)
MFIRYVFMMIITLDTLCFGRNQSSYDAKWLESKYSAESYPGLNEALDRFFVVSDETLVETENKIKIYHNEQIKNNAKYIKAAIVILARQLHCGSNCESPLARRHGIQNCTQKSGVLNLIQSLKNSLFVHNKYPVIIFHEDYNDDDRQHIESKTKGFVNIYWQQIQINEDTLPSYMNQRETILTELRLLHPEQNVTIPNPQIHGFGYRQMCRFYSGLIFHAPILRLFDWYMRLDGGDSKMIAVFKDPFQLMNENNQVYGYSKLFGGMPDSMKLGHYSYLQRTGITSDRIDKPLSDVLLKYKRAYYNNFEIVNMKPFRSCDSWSYFHHFDQKALFLSLQGAPSSNNEPHLTEDSTSTSTWKFLEPQLNPLGDADFRTLALALVTSQDRVKHFDQTELIYAHPVPLLCDEAHIKSFSDLVSFQNFSKNKKNKEERSGKNKVSTNEKKTRKHNHRSRRNNP